MTEPQPMATSKAQIKAVRRELTDWMFYQVPEVRGLAANVLIGLNAAVMSARNPDPILLARLAEDVAKMESARGHRD